MRRLPEFAKYLLVAIVASVIAVGLYSLLNPKPQRSILELQQTPTKLTRAAATAEAMGLDFTAPSRIALPAVVHIASEAERGSGNKQIPDEFYEFFGRPPGGSGPSVSTGSGVILTKDGYIVTNNHVVEGATNVRVTLHDNRSYTAKVVGVDPQTDLALLKIDVDDLSFLKLGDSDAVEVGQWVLAVGNPFNLTSTVTAGIVSAKGRAIGILQNEYGIESFIQTDAAVNPGNSGGALINLNGELVGINTAIASQTGSYAGYAFAIPAKIVTKVVDDLMNYGKVQRGLIGIRIQSVSQELNDEKGLGTVQGVYVAEVNPGGAADEAGIKTGDVILKADDHVVVTSADLLGYIAQKRPGDKVKLTLLRDKTEMERSVTLRSSAGDTRLAEATRTETDRELGLTFSEPTQEELKALDLTGGVKVENVFPGPASRSGIRPGFIITHVQDQRVSSAEEIQTILKKRMEEGKRGTYIEGKYPKGETAVYAFELPGKASE